jgi:hypothetical protein
LGSLTVLGSGDELAGGDAGDDQSITLGPAGLAGCGLSGLAQPLLGRDGIVQLTQDVLEVGSGSRCCFCRTAVRGTPEHRRRDFGYIAKTFRPNPNAVQLVVCGLVAEVLDSL